MAKEKQPKQSTAKATAVRSAKGNYKSRNASGVVTRDDSFTQQAFIEHMGITRTSLNDMKRRGLKTRLDGGRIKITGVDYLEYLQSLPVAEPGRRGGNYEGCDDLVVPTEKVLAGK